MRVRFNTVHESTLLMKEIGKRFKLSLESLRVKTNSKFLEYVSNPKSSNYGELLMSQSESILYSIDDGLHWNEVNLGFKVDCCYTTSQGYRMLYSTEDSTLKIYSPEWRQLKIFTDFDVGWGSTWSIDECPSGTIIWCQYSPTKDQFTVNRSISQGLEWEVVMSHYCGGKGALRRRNNSSFTCSNDRYSPENWYISYGGVKNVALNWKSSDNGETWQEITFNSKGVRGFSNLNSVDKKLLTRNAELIKQDHIIYATSENINNTGVKIVQSEKSDLSSPRIISDIGVSGVSSIVGIGDEWLITISEAVNESSGVDIFLFHPHHGTKKITTIPNDRGLISTFTSSICSKESKNGFFWSFQDGLITGKAKILRWRFVFQEILDNKEILAYRDEDLRGEIEFGSSSLSDYPKNVDVKSSMRDGLPFVHPLDPSLRNEAILKIVEDAENQDVISSEPYDYGTLYLNFYRSNILSNKVVSFDEKLGIPVNKYAHIDSPQPYPVTIGLFALEQITKFHSYGKQEHKEMFEKVCNWLMNNHDGLGNWRIPFEYEFFKGRSGGMMEQGWVSALGQGYCLSALSRFYLMCRGRGDPGEKLTAIEEILELGLVSFLTKVEDGGVLRYFDEDLPFYEEYPTPGPSFVLNGFMFALLGLYDVWKTIGSKTAGKLFQDGIRTLRVSLPYFDLGDRTSYDLTHLQEGNELKPPNPARKGYHETHVRLLDAINSITENQFKDVMVRWILYLYGVIAPNN